MDDMKRAVYMEALRMLKKGIDYYSFSKEAESTGFVCLDLHEALKVIAGVSPLKTLGDFRKLDETLVEFFPEFFELFDGFGWTQAGECFIKRDRHGTWWETCWLKPRIRILEFILNNR